MNDDEIRKGLKYFFLILIVVSLAFFLFILPPFGSNTNFVIFPLGEESIRFRLPVLIFAGIVFLLGGIILFLHKNLYKIIKDKTK
jgi:hypothetical protein